MENSQDNLNRAFGSAAPDELQSKYAAWSSSYDKETMDLGYCLPFVVTAWVARHVDAGDKKILDAGCGTGLTGPYLKALGYTTIDGLDFSPNMLSEASRRGAYRNLVQAELGRALEINDGEYDAVVSAGVFTQGHAPASSFDELSRIVRSGGHVIFTIRDITLNAPEFDAALRQLEEVGRWVLVEKSDAYRSFVLSNPDIAVYTLVYKVC